MSGETIRDVVIKMAVEMASSDIKSPDFSRHRQEVKDYTQFVKKEFQETEQAVKANFERMRAESSRHASPDLDRLGGVLSNGHTNGHTNGHSNGHAIGNAISNGVHDEMDDIRRRFTALKTSAKRLAEEERMTSVALAEAGGGLEGLAAVLTRLPPQAAAAVGAVATVSAVFGGYNAYQHFNREHQQSQMNPLHMPRVDQLNLDSNIQERLRTGTPYAMRDANGGMVRPESLMESWGRNIWSGLRSFSDTFTGMGAEDQLREFYTDASNKQLAAARMAELHGVNSLIGNRRVGVSGEEQRDSIEQGFGFVSTRDRLDRLDTRQADYNEWLQEERKKPGVFGGARGSMLNADESRATLEFAKQRLALQGQLVGELEREKHAYGTLKQAAEEVLHAERERLQSEKERIGSMGPQELFRMNAIGEKLARGGHLNEDEAHWARDHGLRDRNNKVGQFFSDKFDRFVSPQAQETWGTNDAVRAAEEKERTAKRNFADAGPEIDSEIDALKHDARQIATSWPDLVKAQHESSQATIETIQKLTEEFRQLGLNLRNIQTGLQRGNALGAF